MLMIMVVLMIMLMIMEVVLRHCQASGGDTRADDYAGADDYGGADDYADDYGGGLETLPGLWR